MKIVTEVLAIGFLLTKCIYTLSKQYLNRLVKQFPGLSIVA